MLSPDNPPMVIVLEVTISLASASVTGVKLNGLGVLLLSDVVRRRLSHHRIAGGSRAPLQYSRCPGSPGKQRESY